MKKFLSILLSVLMVMSTMSMVVLADNTYTLRALTSTGSNGIGATDMILKGSDVRLAVDGLADGDTVKYYNNGVEINVVAEKDANGAETGVVRAAADGYVNKYTAVISNGGSVVATTAPVIVKAETYAEALPYDNYNKKSDASKAINVTTNTNSTGWTALTDVTAGGKAAKKVDGAIKTNDLSLWNEITVNSYSFYINSAVKRTATLTLMNMKWRNRSCQKGGVWWLDVVKLNPDNTIGSLYMNSHAENLVLAEDTWHTLEVVVNTVKTINNTPTIDIYVDGAVVVADCRLGTSACATCSAAGTTCTPSEFVNNMTVGPFTNADSVYLADPAVETYSISSASVAISEISGNVPADAKVTVTPTNLAADQKVAIVKNGVVTVLTADASGAYTTTVGAGFSTISGAIVDNYNNIIVETESKDVYGIALTPSSDYILNAADWGASQTGLDSIYATYRGNGGIIDATEDGDTYIKIRTWKDANSKPDASATADKNETAVLKTSRISSAANPRRTIAIEMDYRFDEYIVSGTKKAFSANTKWSNVFGTYNFRQDDSYNTSNVLMSANIYTNEGLSSTAFLPIFQARPAGIQACVYKNGTLQRITLDITPNGWHNYKAVADTTTNALYLYVDGNLVASGDLYSANSYGFQNIWTGTLAAWNTGCGASSSIDNLKIYETTVGSAPTTAYIDANANGIIFMPANMTVKPENLAIIAESANGYEVQTWNAFAATETFKPFTFKNAARRIFVWDWSTLKPIFGVITPAE